MRGGDSASPTGSCLSVAEAVWEGCRGPEQMAACDVRIVDISAWRFTHRLIFVDNALLCRQYSCEIDPKQSSPCQDEKVRWLGARRIPCHTTATLVSGSAPSHLPRRTRLWRHSRSERWPVDFHPMNPIPYPQALSMRSWTGHATVNEAPPSASGPLDEPRQSRR